MDLAELKKKIEETYADWEENYYKKTVERYPERQPEFTTPSFTKIKPLYTPDDYLPENYIEEIGYPGKYPFTRGVQPTMYRGRLWTMRQYAGFGTARESNERYRYLLSQGQMGLSVAFDLPTQIGYDSDDPMALGEVGKVGVAIDTLADMEILFDQIPLDKVSTSMTINAPASVLLAMYIAVAEKQGVSKDKLSGTIQNDILKEYVARGTYIFPPKPSMRLITDIFKYCSAEIPKWNTISISGYHIREAGSTAAQEVGFTLADGIAYVEAAINSGLNVDDFAGQLSFFFNSHNDLLEEVAKFRAARRLWAKIMKNRFKAIKPKSMMLRFHAQTAGSALTAQQVDNNIIRVAVQTLAATLGGAQSLHTNSRDEALALPTEESVKIALRTQQIIAYESGVTNTIDPLAGSYYVESLTNQIEKEAEEYIKKIDSLGGMVSAIELGYVQTEIQKSAYKYQQEVEKGERIIIGVNKFAEREEHKGKLLKIDERVQQEQIDFLRKIKSERDNVLVEQKLKELKTAAETDSNLMPYIIDAVKAYSSIGEICNTLRSVFGEYKEQVII
ncbi:methylmalonyl-CoA mutase [Melioribacter roseus P3M-2]|uniref:Methylmalonyl-CoA mutase n=1 Tax=Melioribacter roseus (strain DSM 23840 / JCM 17771 / VKM B-2668 / P3M-2) TaxID=1191523 RepID=I6Z409_MELRP|nr:methylmalonyl-CoA mutase family protein [Melioribacter roseus]AFN73885.1 methylmalonyl-CoA mutase [Melioribacter roseus P3M-2]